MYVRLAFAVAAFLDSDILVVDEVLAVGDADFQKKCLGKMSGVAQSGRTVLFVSHNLSAVGALCGEAVLLEKGRLLFHGPTAECVDLYSQTTQNLSTANWERDSSAVCGPLAIQSINTILRGTQPNLMLCLNLRLNSTAAHKPGFLAVDINNSLGITLMQAIPTLDRFITDAEPTHNLEVEIDLPPLIPGRYLVTVWVGSHYNDMLDMVEEKISFEIEQSPTLGRAYAHFSSHGYIVPHSRVSVQPPKAVITAAVSRE